MRPALNLITLLTAALAAAGLALPARAQPKLAPGLWEVTIASGGGKEMEAAMAQARERMAKMPPDQRKMMEELMARQGVAMSGGGAIRYCLGKDQAERADVPQDADGRCRRDALQTSGNTTRFRFSCSEPPSSGSGEITFSSDKAYAMKMTVTSSGAGGPQTVQVSQTANWVSPDCGTLKPRGPGAGR